MGEVCRLPWRPLWTRPYRAGSGRKPHHEVEQENGEAEEQVIPGAKDKRCLLRLDELALALKLQRGENSTLGTTLITGSGRALEVPNRSGNDLRATDYAVSVIGDTQPETL